MKCLPVSDGRSRGNPVLFLVLAAGVVLVLSATYRLLRRNFYTDTAGPEKRMRGTFNSFGLNRFLNLGETGSYISLEISLLTRNKRPRQGLIMVPFFLIYFGIFISKDANFRNPFILLIFMTMLIGIGASMYGQFMFSWESSYFDAIMARKNNFLKYVKAKYYILCSLSVLVFIPVSVYFFFTRLVDLFLLTSFLMFIMGVNSFIIMYFGTLNDGRLDLAKGRFFNYQGINGSQFILTFVFTLLPVAIYMIFQYLINDVAGELAVAIPGILLSFSITGG